MLGSLEIILVNKVIHPDVKLLNQVEQNFQKTNKVRLKSLFVQVFAIREVCAPINFNNYEVKQVYKVIFHYEVNVFYVL